MTIQAVTTCSAAGWEQYGRRMAQSWAKLWPVPLTVWTEGFACDVAGVNARPLESIAWLAEFKQRHKGRPVANYRMDAVRFAHKTAAVIESALTFDCDHLIWVDADTVTHSRVQMPFVETLLPTGEQYIAWLDRVGNYPECGFYVLNQRHPIRPALLDFWAALYKTDDLFGLKEWHDSYVLQEVIAMAKVQTKSLSGARGRNTPHPFVNSALGGYMDHMKGPRKLAGRSRRADIKVPRSELYWRNVR